MVSVEKTSELTSMSYNSSGNGAEDHGSPPGQGGFQPLVSFPAR